MQKDLKDRLQDIQTENVPNNKKEKKIAIGLAIALVVAILVMIILGTAFVIKIMNALTDSITSAQSGTSVETTTDIFGNSGPVQGARPNRPGNQNSNDLSSDVPIKYGSVSGTSYFSEFSGLSFDAPDDWNVQSYENSKFSTSLSAKDMSASSHDLMTTVSVSYSSMKAHSYNNIKDALESQKKVATRVENNSMVDENIKETIGGNKFIGIRYKKQLTNQTYFIQSMVTECNGYALEIYIEANTEKEIDRVVDMFS